MSSQQDDVLVVGGSDRVTAHKLTSDEHASCYAALVLAKKLNDDAMESSDPAKAATAKRLSSPINSAYALMKNPAATVIVVTEKGPDYGTPH